MVIHSFIYRSFAFYEILYLEFITFTETIDIISDRVYNCKEIPTVLTKDDIKVVNIMYQKRACHTE